MKFNMDKIHIFSPKKKIRTHRVIFWYANLHDCLVDDVRLLCYTLSVLQQDYFLVC